MPATNGSARSTRRPSARDALLALAGFDSRDPPGALRARDPNLAALRLAWWRGVVRGERDEEGAGNPVALALRAAIDAFALPRDRLEAMLDARLQEIAPQDDFNLAAFEAFAEESEGRAAAARVADCGGGKDLDAGRARTLRRGLRWRLRGCSSRCRSKAGAAPTLFPVDVAVASRREAARFRRAPRERRGRCGLRGAAGAGAREACGGGAAA